MATSTMRLTFLYPHLFRSVRVNDSAVKVARQYQRGAPRRANITTTARIEQRFAQRHGTAVEPFLAPGKMEPEKEVLLPVKVTEEKSAAPKKEDTQAIQPEETPATPSQKPLLELSEEIKAASRPPTDPGPKAEQTEETDSSQASAPKVPVAEQAPKKENAASTANEKIASEAPQEQHQELQNIPHLHPPPYVHNFDSYTLVKGVEQGGFTPAQAITSMKAVRLILAENLEVAKEGLVSKADVENESYLFKAACSELRTEVQNMRRTRDEKMRQERTLDQHEVDILNQKLSQELLTVKDDLQEMFNERKMKVRMEQRNAESQIQGLSHKITVALNSDAKSEVEGLRWVLTRRSVLGIMFMALMVLSSLRYASYRAHEEEVERKKQEKKRKDAEEARKHHRTADGETQTDISDPASAAEALAAS